MNFRMQRYDGTCIDGPKRGQRQESQYSYFRFWEQPNLAMMSPINWDRYVPTLGDSAREHEYRWSHSLSQWCLVY